MEMTQIHIFVSKFRCGAWSCCTFLFSLKSHYIIGYQFFRFTFWKVLYWKFQVDSRRRGQVRGGHNGTPLFKSMEKPWQLCSSRKQSFMRLGFDVKRLGRKYAREKDERKGHVCDTLNTHTTWHPYPHRFSFHIDLGGLPSRVSLGIPVRISNSRGPRLIVGMYG